jgi:outer membrane protein assembly factor BamA
VRFAAELTDYHTIVPGVIWAFRLKPGIAWPIAGDSESLLGVHPQKRFFEGGPNSVRGFSQFQLGPKLLTVGATGRLALHPDSGGAGCTAQSINDGTCNASALADDRPDDFDVRPLGGEVSLIGNVEFRFPLYGEKLRAAAFLDYGQVWETGSSVRLSGIVGTPGLGVRYFSPIGPIRVDVGYYGGKGQTLTVITTQVCVVETEDSECVEPEPGVMYDRTQLRDTRTLRVLDMPVAWNPRRTFFERLQFHFSIGQAF